MTSPPSTNSRPRLSWVVAVFAVLPVAVAVAAAPPNEDDPPNLPASKQLSSGQCGFTTDNLVRTGGGNAESQAAVARGLAWLARQQKKDGSWSSDGSDQETVASTALGLLPFLGAGQTHKRTGKENKYKEAVTAALGALVKMQKEDGSFSTNTIANAVAVIALCEALDRTSDKALLSKPCQAAVEFIQKGQGKNGSWGEKYGDEGGTTIVGWHIQALQAAKICKELKVDPKVLEKASKFLDSVASKPKGGSVACLFGDLDSKPHPSFTAVGLLCRYYLNGWGPNSPGLRDGADYLLKEHPPGEKQPFDVGYYYHATQVVRYREDDPWSKEWNPKIRDLLIVKQVQDRVKPEVDGSWEQDKFWAGESYGRLGTTAMALLTLEVYYSHLPLYNRGTSGKDILGGK